MFEVRCCIPKLSAYKYFLGAMFGTRWQHQPIHLSQYSRPSWETLVRAFCATRQVGQYVYSQRSPGAVVRISNWRVEAAGLEWTAALLFSSYHMGRTVGLRNRMPLNFSYGIGHQQFSRILSPNRAKAICARQAMMDFRDRLMSFLFYSVPRIKFKPRRRAPTLTGLPFHAETG